MTELASPSVVLYVAGPLTTGCFTNGIFNLWAWEQNIRRAEVVALECMSLGVAVICVHTQARFWFGQVPEDLAIAADSVLLSRSDAVVLVEGWEYSKGTKAEIDLARSRSMPVLTSVADVAHWLAERITQPIDTKPFLCPDNGPHEFLTADAQKSDRCRNCGYRKGST